MRAIRNEAGAQLHPEPASKGRSALRRDCDRIIHSSAFRRLKHEDQVFVFDEGDHYRTRLTHTLEVAQVARALARALGLDEDLAEALALAHDLGIRRLDMPVSGHSTNVSPPSVASTTMRRLCRVVTTLERRYPSFDGLDLTWETSKVWSNIMVR